MHWRFFRSFLLLGWSCLKLSEDQLILKLGIFRYIWTIWTRWYWPWSASTFLFLIKSKVRIVIRWFVGNYIWLLTGSPVFITFLYICTSAWWLIFVVLYVPFQKRIENLSCVKLWISLNAFAFNVSPPVYTLFLFKDFREVTYLSSNWTIRQW